MPIRTDPRQRDTVLDGVDDPEEVLGFLTGQGIVEPPGVVVASEDRVAGTIACPMDVCRGGANNGDPCRRNQACPDTTCLNGVCNGGPPDRMRRRAGTPGLSARARSPQRGGRTRRERAPRHLSRTRRRRSRDVQRSDETFPGRLVAAPALGCPPELPRTINAFGPETGPDAGICYWCAAADTTDIIDQDKVANANVDVTLNSSRTVTLRAGQGIVLHGVVGDLEGFEEHGCFRGCTMNFVTDFSYDTVHPSGFFTRQLDLRSQETADGGEGEKCAATLFIEVRVN